jgi:hypothetical protein
MAVTSAMALLQNVTDGTVNVRRSRLNLVDLAGSER